MLELNIILFFAGASVGSFINVCIFRMPRGLSVAGPRSFCPCCSSRLRWFELIPVAGFLLSKGRCRTCGCALPVEEPLIELLCGAVPVLSVALFGVSQAALETSLFILCLVPIAVIDWRHLIIPDSILAAGLVGGVLVRFIDSPEAVVFGLLSAAVAGITLLTIRWAGNMAFRRESMGWGDVKLAVVLGFFLGYWHFLIVVWLAAAAGAVYGILRMRFRLGRAVAANANLYETTPSRLRRDDVANNIFGDITPSRSLRDRDTPPSKQGGEKAILNEVRLGGSDNPSTPSRLMRDVAQGDGFEGAVQSQPVDGLGDTIPSGLRRDVAANNNFGDTTPSRSLRDRDTPHFTQGGERATPFGVRTEEDAGSSLQRGEEKLDFLHGSQGENDENIDPRLPFGSFLAILSISAALFRPQLSALLRAWMTSLQ